jgi:hypothetical protein
MLKLNFIWKRSDAQYSNSYILRLNKCYIGQVVYNSLRPKGDTKEIYFGSLILYPNEKWFDKSGSVLMTLLEQKVTEWFEEALKGSKQE